MLLKKWSNETKSRWNDQITDYKRRITSTIPFDGGLAVTEKMQSWIKAVEPLNTSLDGWSNETKSTWQDQLNAYKKKITSSIPSDGGITATEGMQSWLKTVEPLATSLDNWSSETRSTWNDQINAYKAKITSTIPSDDGGLAAIPEMQSWMKAVEPLDTSLKEWSGQDNATLQNPINAYKAKITSSIPSGGGIAGIADMQNWLKTAEPLAISLGQWSNQAKATWKDQLASYIAKITSSVPSGEGIAATQKMQTFIKAIEQLNTSLDKWPSEAKSTWNDQLAAYKAKIASAIPSDRIAVIADMQNWMKAVELLLVLKEA